MSKIKLPIESMPIDKNSINNIMEDCEIYREKLIMHCQMHFDYDYETAADCVQDAYVALYDNLLRGKEISNYRAWLYQVAINYKNKAIAEKIKRNEYEFTDNEEKDSILNNTLTYTPDYVENMVTDEVIEERALIIISSLKPDEKSLFVEHYWNKKTFVEIGKELNTNPSTIGKRHGKLKKKILKMIADYEKS